MISNNKKSLIVFFLLFSFVFSSIFSIPLAFASNSDYNIYFPSISRRIQLLENYNQFYYQKYGDSYRFADSSWISDSDDYLLYRINVDQMYKHHYVKPDYSSSSVDGGTTPYYILIYFNGISLSYRNPGDNHLKFNLSLNSDGYNTSVRLYKVNGDYTIPEGSSEKIGMQMLLSLDGKTWYPLALGDTSNSSMIGSTTATFGYVAGEKVTLNGYFSSSSNGFYLVSKLSDNLIGSSLVNPFPDSEYDYPSYFCNSYNGVVTLGSETFILSGIYIDDMGDDGTGDGTTDDGIGDGTTDDGTGDGTTDGGTDDGITDDSSIPKWLKNLIEPIINFINKVKTGIQYVFTSIRDSINSLLGLVKEFTSFFKYSLSVVFSVFPAEFSDYFRCLVISGSFFALILLLFFKK